MSNGSQKVALERRLRKQQAQLEKQQEAEGWRGLRRRAKRVPERLGWAHCLVASRPSPVTAGWQ